MSTVLVIEDQFLVSYDLECVFKERVYKVRHAATLHDALGQYRASRKRNELTAVVCDNRLIGDKPAAKSLYRAIRNDDAETPFIVYSGFPPADLPKNDPRLALVRKPFADQVLTQLERFTLQGAEGHSQPVPSGRREAA